MTDQSALIDQAANGDRDALYRLAMVAFASYEADPTPVLYGQALFAAGLACSGDNEPVGSVQHFAAVLRKGHGVPGVNPAYLDGCLATIAQLAPEAV